MITSYPTHCYRTVLLTAAALIIPLLSLPAQVAPALNLRSSDLSFHASSGANETPTGKPTETEQAADSLQRLWSTGVPGELAGSVYARAGVYMLTHPVEATGMAQVMVQNIGSGKVRVRWYAVAASIDKGSGFRTAWSRVEPYLNLRFGIDGARSDSTTLYYAWSQRVYIDGTPGRTGAGHTLRLNDSTLEFPMLVGDIRRENMSGSYRVSTTSGVTIESSSLLQSFTTGARLSPDAYEEALLFGELIVSIAGPIDHDLDDLGDWGMTPLFDPSARGGAASVSDALSDASSMTIASAPNPFASTTTISYALPESGATALEVFNAAGARVRTLVDDERGAGSHSELWDGADDAGAPVPNGAYFFRIRQSGRSSSGYSASGRVVVKR